jgi:hypothetical protein
LDGGGFARSQPAKNAGCAHCLPAGSFATPDQPGLHRVAGRRPQVVYAGQRGSWLQGRGLGQRGYKHIPGRGRVIIGGQVVTALTQGDVLVPQATWAMLAMVDTGQAPLKRANRCKGT